MTNHPKERPDSLSRRNFLLKSAGAAVSLSAAGPLLAACGNTTSVQESTGKSGELVGPGGLPLARPDKRVVLPRWEDPIESGLQPETGGTFTVYAYPSYLYKKVLTSSGPGTASTSSTRRSTTSTPDSSGSPPERSRPT